MESPLLSLEPSLATELEVLGKLLEVQDVRVGGIPCPESSRDVVREGLQEPKAETKGPRLLAGV